MTAFLKLKKAALSTVREDYMKEDIYPVKILTISMFDKSVAMLTRFYGWAFKWRKQVKVDQWQNPNFFEQFDRKGDYPIFTDGLDRQERPIIEGFCNVRVVAVSGKIKHLTNYALRAFERATTKIRAIQQGRNATPLGLFTWIGLMGLIKLVPHCHIIISFYLGYMNYFEKVWPKTVS